MNHEEPFESSAITPEELVASPSAGDVDHVIVPRTTSHPGLWIVSGAATIGVTVFVVISGKAWIPFSVAIGLISALVSLLLAVRVAQWFFVFVPLIVGVSITVSGSSWVAWVGGGAIIAVSIACAVAIACKGPAVGRDAFDRLVIMAHASRYQPRIKTMDWLRK